jgi:predicted HTH transcriptional regulator
VSRQRHWHALPVGWEQLDYDELCAKRLKLIAEVTRQGFGNLVSGGEPAPDRSAELRDVIARGESATLEFKERARWSHGTEKQGLAEHIIAKTISGFMKAEGGSLLVGVADDGRVTGIEADYETLSKADRDGFELFLVQLVADKITGPSPSLCRITFHNLDSMDVCRIDVAASAKPVFTRPRNGKEHTDFWVRLGNRTDQYYGTEQAEYLADHWG